MLGEKEWNMLGEKEWKNVAQQFSPAHRAINFSQLLKWNLLPETYNFSGSTVVFVVNFEYIWHVVLVGFFADLKYGNSGWNTLLS